MSERASTGPPPNCSGLAKDGVPTNSPWVRSMSPPASVIALARPKSMIFTSESPVSMILLGASLQLRTNGLVNYKTRIEGGWHEAVLVKRRLHAIVVWLSIFTIFTATDAAKAGPFKEFFSTVRSAIAHPKETPRPHRSTHKRRKTPPSDAPNSETLGKPTPAL